MKSTEKPVTGNENITATADPAGEIVLLNVNRIHPHPNNPRKDLGDLSELTESIKKNGVMQNFTVILIEGKSGEYTILIGHRRHAAATQADVTEVPCRIVKGMSEKEQMGIMLEENMQRNDLTIYEQAQGFQMMLDLGETEDTIAQKTGFSKSTIRHRLNIAKLDQKELQKKEKDGSFQLTLKDLYELEKVKDIKTRNKILKEANSSRDLVWKAQNAVSEAIRAQNAKQITDMLIAVGVKAAPKNAENERYTGKWETVKEYDLDKDVPKQIRLKDADNMYYLHLPYYRSMRVIKLAKKEKHVETPEEAKRKQRDRDTKEIKAKMKEMGATRKEFIQNIIAGKIDAIKNEDELRHKVWKVLIEAGCGLYLYNMRSFFTGKQDYECKSEEKAEAQKQVDSLSFTHSMLVMMHHALEHTGDIVDWNGYYNPEKGMTFTHAYEVLRPYGWAFVLEDDEQLINGTHPLYAKKAEVSDESK